MKTISLQEKYNRDRMNVLLEVIDASEIKKIAQVFKEINRVIGNANLPSVKSLISAAAQDMSSLQSQGFFKQLLGAATLNVGQKRTMSSIVTLQTQLVSMLKSVPDMVQIATAALGGGGINEAGLSSIASDAWNEKGAFSKNKSQSSQSDSKPIPFTDDKQKKETDNNNSMANALKSHGAEGQKALSNLEKMIKKALQPGIVDGLFSKYKIDADAITREILELSVQDFENLANKASGANIKVPIEKEDVQDLQGAEEKTDPGSVLSKITPDQAESYMAVIGVLEKIGQKINPEIKKALASRLKAGRDQEAANQ